MSTASKVDLDPDIFEHFPPLQRFPNTAGKKKYGGLRDNKTRQCLLSLQPTQVLSGDFKKIKKSQNSAVAPDDEMEKAKF